MLNYGKLIMLLVDHDNNKIVTECNDNLTYANITIFSFGNVIKNCTVSDLIVNDLIVNDLTSAISAVMNYYR